MQLPSRFHEVWRLAPLSIRLEFGFTSSIIHFESAQGRCDPGVDLTYWLGVLGDRFASCRAFDGSIYKVDAAQGRHTDLLSILVGELESAFELSGLLVPVVS